MLTQEETLKKIVDAQNGSESAKVELINSNLPLIKSIVRRYKNKQIEYDDLIQLGTLGLIKAINNFNVDFGVRFSTYAVPMVAGEIKRFIRDDGAIKVSRAIKADAMKINKFIDENRLKGKEVSLQEISDEFNIDVSEVVFILESTRYPVSIYAESEEEGLTLADKIPAKGSFDDEIDKILLKDMLIKLPERERKVIFLRYFKDKTQSEIAEILGVSQVQISRIESKIIQKLRENFLE